MFSLRTKREETSILGHKVVTGWVAGILAGAKLNNVNFLGPLVFFNFINSEAIAYSKRL
jgi:hypothetical protein